MDGLTWSGDPFTLEERKREWPLRLLHVPSMVSHERDQDNRYDAIKEPRYNALSYTWGRWKVESGPSLDVKGLRWGVPSISPSAFTVSQFHKAVMQASQEVEFLWLDVVCIDQEEWAAKMEEIGRQAAIFNGASRVFVWLHSLQIDDLDRYSTRLYQLADRVYDEAVARASADSDSSDDDNAVAPSKSGVLACFEDKVWVSDFVGALTALLDDPWFTSLWTLQEMHLRSDATILSKTGQQIGRADDDDIEDRQGVTVANLIVYCNTILDEMVALSENDLCRLGLDSVHGLIDRLGFAPGGFENPAVLYTMSQYRTTMYPLDRVYGIMQVFGFRLGESAEPEATFTLPQLEEQLGAAMNARSPVWSQLFAHTEEVELGQCWRINRYSRLPREASFAEALPSSSCSIYMDSCGKAVFEGQFTLLRDLLESWYKSDELEGLVRGSKRASRARFIFDAGDHGIDPNILASLSLLNGNQDLKHFHGLLEPNVCILLIGKLQDGADDDSDELIGVVSIQVQSPRGLHLWKRIGICMWPSTNGTRSWSSGIWKAEQLYLG